MLQNKSAKISLAISLCAFILLIPLNVIALGKPEQQPNVTNLINQIEMQTGIRIRERKKPLHCLQKAPPYIKFENGVPVMQFGVLNRTKLIDDQLLADVLHVLTKQVTRDFFQYYGILVKFHVLEDENSVDWKYFVPLVFPDLLINPNATVAFHSIQAEISLDGEPIASLIANPPDLPEGTPYAIIPMGTPDTNYGIIPLFLLHRPNFPPTFETMLSWATSHEILETLHDYAANKYYAINNYQNGELKSISFYIGEVCDPTDLFSGYIIDNFNVSNFVFPNFWVPTSAKRPFDFLNTIPAPLTPFGGTIPFLKIHEGTGIESWILLSPPTDPTQLIFLDPETLISCSSNDELTLEKSVKFERKKGAHYMPTFFDVKD